jgi:hypothetical protein
MGTRHLICIVQDELYKLAQYGQWDGYLRGQGKEIINFFDPREPDNEEIRIPFDLAKFKERVRKIRTATPAEVEEALISCGAPRGAEYITMGVSDKFQKNFPQFERAFGAKVLPHIMATDNAVVAPSEIDFAADSLFCEYAYVINLDKNILEIYRGFNESPLDSSERFFFLQERKAHEVGHRKSQYYPVRHLIDLPLNDMPFGALDLAESALKKAQGEEGAQ